MPYSDPIVRKEYQRKYREKNKKKRKNLWKRWYQKNKIKHNEYNKQWYQKNRKKNTMKAKENYYKNREKRKIVMKLWYQKNKEYTKKYKKKNYSRDVEKKEKILQRHLNTWKNYVPSETNCQICSRKIYFNQNNIKNAIHFDHKDENALIKGSPTNWLSNNERTPENQKIWEQCTFGNLCNRCNIRIPSKDRKQFVRSLVKYVFGDNATIVLE